ncbi:hypothetical protein FRB95_009449 [Tulasnella sp. JGI-2019a]|nr:hypothetical protein FRB95_009449 [Tulasnella sp. JGI-2019a]
MLLSTSPIILAAAISITLLTPVHAGWINDLRPRTTPTPRSCTATCPSHVDGDTLQCVYVNPDGYCEYDIPTGLRSRSNQIEDCPPWAENHSCPTKRSSAMKRWVDAANPQPAAIPLNMRSLSALKKSKLAARDLKALEEERERM